MSQSAASYGLAEKIARQLSLDSEDLEKSMLSYHETRKGAIQMQVTALADYEDEMAAIGYVDEEYEFEEEDVDHNIARHLNIDKEADDDDWEMDGEFEQEEGEVVPKEKFFILEGVPKKIKKPYLPEDKKIQPPSMKQKKDMREKMFSYLDEARIAEMRLELAYEAAKNDDELDMKKLDDMAEDLYVIRKKNSTALFDFMDSYQANPNGKVWGNDPDYMIMLKALSSLGQMEGGARKEISQQRGQSKKKH
jgi:hypothetical protein